MACPYTPINGYKTIKVFRNGPRYFVALIEDQKGHQFVIKKLLDASNSWARDALSKEILFTNWVVSLGDKSLASYFLNNHDFEVQGNSVWRVQAFCAGKFQNREPSPFLLSDSFSEDVSPVELSNFLSRLHAVTASLPKQLTDRLGSFTLAEYEKFINWDDLPIGVVGVDLNRKIRAFLDSETPTYNSSRRVLTHFEFYGPHILKREDKSLVIIDWENVGVSVESHDVVSIWLRAFQNSNWQEVFLSNFRKGLSSGSQFEAVFRVEVVLQSLGNIAYFSRSDIDAEKNVKDLAIQFFVEQVRNNIG